MLEVKLDKGAKTYSTKYFVQDSVNGWVGLLRSFEYQCTIMYDGERRGGGECMSDAYVEEIKSRGSQVDMETPCRCQGIEHCPLWA